MNHLNHLLYIVSQLRDKKNGCPWDQEQTFSTIAPYTLEETYEVIDAIKRDDMDSLKEELGDLLFHVAFLACLAEELDLFSFSDVIREISAKMVRRHPHVFEKLDASKPRYSKFSWENIKIRERSNKYLGASVLEGVAETFPALMRASKLQDRASQVGFNWDDAHGVLDKIEEEIREVRQVLNQLPNDRYKMSEELGNLFFSCVTLSRHLRLDAEMTLRDANIKFSRRFRAMEDLVSRQGRELKNCSLSELEIAWGQIKDSEDN